MNLEDRLEQAFQEFNNARKGDDEWQWHDKEHRERLAFKSVLRKFINGETLSSQQPLSRIIREGDSEFCEKCGSGIVRKFWIGTKLGCRQPRCSNFHNK